MSYKESLIISLMVFCVLFRPSSVFLTRYMEQNGLRPNEIRSTLTIIRTSCGLVGVIPAYLVSAKSRPSFWFALCVLIGCVFDLSVAWQPDHSLFLVAGGAKDFFRVSLAIFLVLFVPRARTNPIQVAIQVYFSAAADLWASSLSSFLGQLMWDHDWGFPLMATLSQIPVIPAFVALGLYVRSEQLTDRSLLNPQLNKGTAFLAIFRVFAVAMALFASTTTSVLLASSETAHEGLTWSLSFAGTALALTIAAVYLKSLSACSTFWKPKFISLLLLICSVSFLLLCFHAIVEVWWVTALLTWGWHFSLLLFSQTTLAQLLCLVKKEAVLFLLIVLNVAESLVGLILDLSLSPAISKSSVSVSFACLAALSFIMALLAILWRPEFDLPVLDRDHSDLEYSLVDPSLPRAPSESSRRISTALQPRSLLSDHPYASLELDR
jgi:hypothetical protein